MLNGGGQILSKICRVTPTPPQSLDNFQSRVTVLCAMEGRQLVDACEEGPGNYTDINALHQIQIKMLEHSARPLSRDVCPGVRVLSLLSPYLDTSHVDMILEVWRVVVRLLSKDVGGSP